MPEKKDDYIDKAWGSLVVFMDTFENGLNTYAATFNIPVETVNSLTAKMLATKTDHAALEAAKVAAKSAAEKFRQTRDDMIKSVRKTVNQIKPNDKYTTVIGKDMGIEGEETHYDPATMQPVLKITVNAGIVEIDFVKSFSQGVNIYSKRADETDFSFLARDTESPYFDNRPNITPGRAENRLYYAYYIFKDEEQGLPSEIYEIAVKG